MTIPPDLQEFILRRSEMARARAVDALISTAGAYRDEIGRQDNLHRARLRQREETMMLAAEDLLATRRPLVNLTHADLDLYRRSMEAAAEREEQASTPSRPGSYGRTSASLAALLGLLGAAGLEATDSRHPVQPQSYL